MMDRDFPMTPRQAKAMVIGLLVMVVVGIALFGGLIPGLKPNYALPATVMVDGHPYYYTSVAVPWPPLGVNSTPPEELVFHNTTFWVWVTGWYSVSGGYLEGNLTLTNDSTYAFLLGGAPTAANYTIWYLAPGGGAGIAWAGGLSFELYVAAPENATA
jgi:hypothetical protein